MRRNRIVGIIGVKGSGKSHLAKRYFASADRSIVNDTMGEYETGFCVSERLAFAEYLRDNERFRIAYLPIEESDFDFVCRCARAKGSLLFIVEEVSQYSSAGFVCREFSKCIQLGRHFRLDIIYTAQRFADIPRRLTSQTDEFHLFRLAEPRDLDAVRARFGESVANDVEGLSSFQAIWIDVSGEKTNEYQRNRSSDCLGASIGILRS